MVYLLKLLNLSGVIASIASFPLVIVPVGIYLFIQHRGPEMRPWQKKALGVTFALGICAYAVDVADRFGHVDPLLAKLPPEIITDQTFINREVQLTGYLYNHCVFDHVTFLIESNRQGGVTNSKVGSYSISSHNPAILGAMHYLNLLGFLRVPFMLDGKIEPPFGPGAKFHSEPLSPFDNQQGQ